MSSTFKNLMLLILAVVALVVGFQVAKSLRQPEAAPASLTYGGGAMINFTLPEVDGVKHSLEEWRGKVIVLNFWATWCLPCRDEIPLLVDLQKKRGADGLQVIGVAIDNKTAVMLFRRSNNMTYPVLMGDDDTLGLIARYGNSAGALPFTVIIDRSGSIAVRKLGPFTKTELESLVEPLIGPASTTIPQTS